MRLNLAVATRICVSEIRRQIGSVTRHNRALRLFCASSGCRSSLDLVNARKLWFPADRTIFAFSEHGRREKSFLIVSWPLVCTSG